MSDLTIRSDSAPQLDPMKVAQVFRASGMFPDIQSEAQAATKIIIGRGLGLTDFDAMSGLHIIKGKAVLAANLMAAAIKRAGKYDYRSCVNDDEARIEFRQRTHDGKWETIGITSFTMEDAKRANLGGDNWRKYPKAMLFARAISSGYKQHCPDALGAAPVYVEAHGESEIPDEPKPDPKAKALSPAAMRSLSPAERKAETERLLASTREEFDGREVPSDEFTIPAGSRIASVKTKTGEVWRVDIEGRDPIAVREPSIASAIEANLAFSEPTYCRLTHDGKRDIVTEIVKAPKEVTA